MSQDYPWWDIDYRYRKEIKEDPNLKLEGTALSRYRQYIKEEQTLDALFAKRKKLLEEVKATESEMLCQKDKIKQSEYEWKHPYIDAFHECLKIIQVTRICFQYLVDDVCLGCRSTYLGSKCANCLVNGYNREKIDYYIKGKIKKVEDCGGCIVADYFAMCYELTDQYDIEVISYWRNQLKKRNASRFQSNKLENEFRYTPFHYCKNKNQMHLSVVVVSHNNKLHKEYPKGMKLTLSRGGYICYSISGIESYLIQVA